MATLQESLSADLSGYVPVEKMPRAFPSIDTSLQPQLNPFLRCPIPPVSASPDSLRQFYLGGKVPQMRLIPPPSDLSSSSGTVIQNTTVVSTSASSSSGSGSGSSTLTAKQASITSPTLNPNDTFVGSLLLAKSFQLLSISANSPCRIQIYGTALAQTTDSGRTIDVAPAAGVFQNIISDVVLDTAPYTLPYQNRIGANGDSPQSSLIYVTISNIDVSSDVITVTISYVPLQS